MVNDGFTDSPANQTLVTVLNLDKAPYVKDSIKNISVEKGMTDQVIDLKTVFADDDITDILEYSVTSNLNEQVVIARITNTTLTLTFSKINAGKSELIITASSNGKSVQSKFSVEVKLPTAIDPVSYTRVQ